MKIAYISTSLPTECGIATFNANLFLAINQHKTVSNDSFVVALSDSEELKAYNYPPEVKYIIRQNNQKDYLRAADYVNTSQVDACIIEHEFGIYGGESGLYVLSLMARINKPIITILHTVLKQPSYVQQTIIQQIAKRSAKIVVMSQKAIGFLTSIYNIPKSKIKYIEHGVADLEPPTTNPIKNAYPFKDKKVLFTFGLISRNKGLETAISALPEIIKQHPDSIYVVLGNTHPGVVKNVGEEYRDSLKRLARKLDVEKHLVFVNKFVDEKELHHYLSAADIYITPYLNEAQITSGTLSYAVGAGAAVISTPYWHAQELLSNNRGLLFDFQDSQQLATLVNDLFAHPSKLNQLKYNAYRYGLSLRWPNIGKNYIAVLQEAIQETERASLQGKPIIDADSMPTFNLSHVKRLTDDTGIVQHAKYGIPNLKEGYCLDDNARALIMALMAFKQYKSREALELLPVYLSYIQYMQREDGNFRNFLSFDRNYLDEVGSEDSFGRTIWSLGYLINHAPNNSYKEFATELFLKSVPHFSQLQHLRGVTNTIIGLYHYLVINPHHVEMMTEMQQLVDPLVKAYENNSNKQWQWFEQQLTYDNALLPLALLCHYQITKEEKSFTIAKKTLDFLTEKTLGKGYLNPVGNNGWLKKNEPMALYDQQAIETMAMVLVYFKAYEITKELKYMHHLYQSYQWFLGENSLNLPLYDHETKGCADGLQALGVNRNQGAESTLAYLISHLVVFKALEIEYKYLADDNKIKEDILEN
ncbi:glycosyltransferase family 4 protein [Pedobacter sp. ASV28]|uniref:glycosyltransferase family 4 protein n=1 Tax=Pedobacter sp. ASV28 TaxID=2795123 RepID=UPI0018ED4F0D|nr:glycosyltransferase family 4 protein [Pedobacter sp. ASV28]